MGDRRIDEVLRMLDPPPRKTVWEIALHVAYWKYDVRRKLLNLPEGSFPRSPSNWPDMPDRCDEKAWKKDRSVLRSEHRGLVEAIREMDPGRLDAMAPGSKRYRTVDLLFGVVMHDVHHVGQIQLMKRMAP